MLGNIGFSELMIILLVVLLVFGAKRLPEIGSSIGKGIREFKNSLRDTSEDEPRAVPPPAPGAPLGTSRTDGEPKRLAQ